MRTEEGPARVPGTESSGSCMEVRRRLLRGSFSAPAVLSLSSGSAFANSVNCLAKAPRSIDAPPETPFSVQRYSVTVGSTPYKVVKAADISSKATISGYGSASFVAGKTWIDVATSGNLDVGSAAPTSEPGVFVALRFENMGTEQAPLYAVTGLGQSETIYSGSGQARVMSESCWNSIKP